MGLNLWEKSLCLWSFWQESRQFPCIGFYLPDSQKGWEASARVGTWGCILPPTLPRDTEHPQTPQASTPLLLKEQQELRRRVQRPTLESEGPGVQQPGESFYDRLLRCFQKMLQRLQEIWQDVLTWVKEKAAHLCDTVKAIWNEVKSFFSSMEQLFLSPLQA